jgi:hypothetical protein
VEVRQKCIDRIRYVVFSVYDLLRDITEDDDFIPAIKNLGQQFFSFKNILKKKTPQNLTELLIDKYFNSQRLKTIEDFA